MIPKILGNRVRATSSGTTTPASPAASARAATPYRLIALAFAVTLVVSLLVVPGITAQAGGPAGLEISVDKESIEWGPDGGEVLITVTTNQPQWQLNTSGWPSTERVGTNQLRAKTGPNTSDKALSGYLRFFVITVYGEYKDAWVSVFQAGKGAELSVSQTDWKAAGIGDALGLFVTTNQGITQFGLGADWLHVAWNWGGPENPKYAVLQADRNPDPTPRTSIVRVSADNAMPVYITVTQAGGPSEPTITLGLTEYRPDAGGGDCGFYAFTNEFFWTVKSDRDWLTVQTDIKDERTWVVATAAPNDTSEERVGVLTFTAGTATATFKVTQAGKDRPPYIFLDTGSWNTAAEGGQHDVVVSTNQPGWRAYSNADWVTISPSSGVNGDKVVINVAANPGSTNRTAQLTFIAGNQSVTFTVTQSGQLYVKTDDDLPLAGNWTGRNGGSTIGKYRPAISTFYLRNSNTTGGADITVQYGNPGDIPVVGDWDGDGVTTIGVWRPSEAKFYLRNSNTPGPADIVIPYGRPGDKPVAGDWTGTGRTSVGVYTNEGSIFHLRLNLSANSGELEFWYGDPYLANTPVAGSWNGAGRDTVGVFLNNYSLFYLKNTNEGGVADTGVWYGMRGNLPVVGDWDGNGTDTVGVFWPSNGQFYLRNTNTDGIGEVNPKLIV